jgi:hypothetical protein
MNILRAVVAAIMSLMLWVATIILVMLVAVYLARLAPLAGRRRGSKTAQPK